MAKCVHRMNPRCAHRRKERGHQCGLDPEPLRFDVARRQVRCHSRYDALGAVAAHQADGGGRKTRDAREDGVSVAKGRIQRIGERVNAISILGPEASAFHAELNQVAWVLDWQEAQQNLIDERKNRSIRCYAEGERQHGGGRKARIETYLPYAIPSILEKSFGRSRECHACSTV